MSTIPQVGMDSLLYEKTYTPPNNIQYVQPPQLGMESLQHDPYFLEALRSPNNYQYMQAQYYGATPPQNLVQGNDTASQQLPQPNEQNVTINSASEQIAPKEEKKSSAAGWLCTAVGTIIAGIGIYKCRGRGAKRFAALGREGNFFQKTWRGFQEYWNKGINRTKKLKFANIAEEGNFFQNTWRGFQGYWNKGINLVKKLKFTTL